MLSLRIGKNDTFKVGGYKGQRFPYEKGDKEIFWIFVLVIRRDYKQKKVEMKNCDDKVKLSDYDKARLMWIFTALDIWKQELPWKSSLNTIRDGLLKFLKNYWKQTTESYSKWGNDCKLSWLCLKIGRHK